MDQNNKENHLLNLKVMRLSKPNIPTINPILCEKDDIAYETMLSSNDSSSLSMGSNSSVGGNGTTVTSVNPSTIEGLGITSMLQLQSGVIYLGEMFCCYISLNNHSPYQVNNVFLKVELQTTSQRINLLDSEQQPVSAFSPGFSSDFVVQREVKESGVNILVCAVNYTTPEGEHKKFRKYFKFQVMNPLVLKTRIHNLPNVVFLEACLENATQGSLFIESILFEPIEHFTSKDISFQHNLDSSEGGGSGNGNGNNNNSIMMGGINKNQIDENIEKETRDILQDIKISSDIVFLKQGSSRQYLFQITPKDINNVETKNSLPLGRLDITWRSYFGEIGRLKTAAIQRKLNTEDIECSLINIPSKIQLEKPFTITAKLSNKSNRTLYPQFTLIRNKMDGIKINSHLPKLDSIPPQTTQLIDVEMFPLKPGMQQIIGLAIKLIEPTIQQQAQNQIKPTLGQSMQPQFHQQQAAAQAAAQATNPNNPPKNFYEFTAADAFVEYSDVKLIDL